MKMTLSSSDLFGVLELWEQIVLLVMLGKARHCKGQVQTKMSEGGFSCLCVNAEYCMLKTLPDCQACHMLVGEWGLQQQAEPVPRLIGYEFSGEGRLVLDVAHKFVGDEDVDAIGSRHVDVGQLGEGETHQSCHLGAHLSTGQSGQVHSLVDQGRLLHTQVQRLGSRMESVEETNAVGQAAYLD